MKKKIFSLSNFFYFIAFMILLAIPVMRFYHSNKGMAKIKSFESLKLETFKQDKKNVLEATPYTEDSKQDEIVGTISIPKIYEKIGIYDNETQENLDKGVAIYARFTKDDFGNQKRIVNELSLDPRLNKNIVLLGHSGTSYTNQDIFLNITKLEKGDKFEINNGKQILEFEVCNLLTVLPQNVDEMYKISDANPKENYASLVTCVPARINTHRLIVQGKLVNVKQLNLKTDIPNKTLLQQFKDTDLLNKVAICFLGIGFLIFIVKMFIKLINKLKNKKQLKEKKGNIDEKSKK